jgi:hypothetical protein
MVGSNLAEAWLSVLASVVCCQVEVSELGWSPVQRTLTECGVFECDTEVLTMRRLWPAVGCYAMVIKTNTSVQ